MPGAGGSGRRGGASGGRPEGELHIGYGGAALMAGDSGSGRRGKLGRAPGAGRGVEGEGEGPFAKQGRGEEPG